MPTLFPSLQLKSINFAIPIAGLMTRSKAKLKDIHEMILYSAYGFSRTS
jgi:hypothetical protein